MPITLLAFLVVLGVTVTIHEFGHFAMAKLLKIRVHVFSIGFGRRLFGFERGGTDYRLSLFPIGGYVKMAGENYEDERQGAPDEFLSHPRWHRFLVYIAGPLMNILLAVAVLTYPYLEGVSVPRYLSEAPVVGPVAARTPAHRAGMRSGDRILEVKGSSVRTWEGLEVALATLPKGPFELTVQRGLERRTLQLDPGPVAAAEAAALGFRASLPNTVVALVDPDSPASKAGLQPGDEIVSVEGNGRSGRTYDDILGIISESPGVALQFGIKRPAKEEPGGRLFNLTITPKEDQGRSVIGFRPEVPTILEKHGLAGAIVMSARRNVEISRFTFQTIGRIVTGAASVRTLSGPLEIARYSGSAARTGSARVFLGFLAMVSLQLGLFNLLPIPILDGGGILLLLVEAVIRRDLSLRLKERIVQVGFVFLIVLMGFVILNDLSKIPYIEKLIR